MSLRFRRRCLLPHYYGDFKEIRTNSIRAFSTVVADNQFATLGIVLLATLARLARASGIQLGSNANVGPKIKHASAVAPIEEDRGERVPRKQTEGLNDVPISSPAVRSSKDDYKNQRKKPSRRKKNAIDDLFSGLL